MGKKCIICQEAAPYKIDDCYWHWGPKPSKQEREQLWNVGRRQHYCRPHFLETFKELLNESQGRFIFFKEDKYFGEYIYLSLERLRFHPAKYTEEDIGRILHLLESMEVQCQKCQNNIPKVLLMDCRVIEYSVKSPLIKNESALQSKESICVECFIKFLAEEIQRRRKEFWRVVVNIPYNEKGIYLFEQ